MPKYENRSGPGRSGLRATDQQRDEYCRVLNEAYARGQLTRAEWDARSGPAYTVGVTLGRLEYLVADLREPPVVIDGLVPRAARHRAFRTELGRSAARSVRLVRRRVIEPLLLAVASWGPFTYFVHRWPGVMDRETVPGHVATIMAGVIILGIAGSIFSLFWAMLRD